MQPVVWSQTLEFSKVPMKIVNIAQWNTSTNTRAMPQETLLVPFSLASPSCPFYNISIPPLPLEPKHDFLRDLYGTIIMCVCVRGGGLQQHFHHG
jgi:hypothetical protein